MHLLVLISCLSLTSSSELRTKQKGRTEGHTVKTPTNADYICLETPVRCLFKKIPRRDHFLGPPLHTRSGAGVVISHHTQRDRSTAWIVRLSQRVLYNELVLVGRVELWLRLRLLSLALCFWLRGSTVRKYRLLYSCGPALVSTPTPSPPPLVGRSPSLAL